MVVPLVLQDIHHIGVIFEIDDNVRELLRRLVTEETSKCCGETIRGECARKCRWTEARCLWNMV